MTKRHTNVDKKYGIKGRNVGHGSDEAECTVWKDKMIISALNAMKTIEKSKKKSVLFSKMYKNHPNSGVARVMCPNKTTIIQIFNFIKKNVLKICEILRFVCSFADFRLKSAQIKPLKCIWSNF